MYTDRRKPWIHRMLLWILGLLPERRTNLVLWDCGEFSMDVRDNINSDFRYDSFGRLKGLGNRWYRYSIREKHRFRKACERYDARDYNHRHYASLFHWEVREMQKRWRHKPDPELVAMTRNILFQYGWRGGANEETR